MYILGISAYYHDSAVALLKNGAVVAAMQEERFSRIKHDHSFPEKALQHCLKLEGISINEVSHIVFYEKPFWKFERILDTITNQVPFSFIQFAKAIPLWVKRRLWIGQEIKKKSGFKGKILYASHHESHAAAAFFSSPFERSAILTIDGVGELATTTLGTGNENQITTLKEIQFPHSLGLLYAAFTQYCGFKVNSGEYKLMGLAVYGKPNHKQIIYDHLINQHGDGSFELNLEYFNYTSGLTMINRKFENLFGKPARKPESDMDAFYMDVAASIQLVLEEIVLNICKRLKEITQLDHIVFSGGVALNCKLNQKIVESGIFKHHYFYPSAGDAGSALGAAYLGWYNYLNNSPKQTHSTNENQYLGNSYANETIKNWLDQHAIVYAELSDLDPVVDHLTHGKIIGWFNGRMEFGPRALGNRTILADPRNATMKDILNEKIKLREKFRPFAPIVLEEYATDLFELHDANYQTMMVTAKAKNHAKLIMPAVIHLDETARIQLVNQTSSILYELLSRFYAKTQCPALINTSFNVRGEPMVESPNDAMRTFLNTEMDLLVFNGRFIIDKNGQPQNLFSIFKPGKYEAD